MLTPQAIKDQEFNIKFRGYDAIEVKAYLELLAEDFFDLTEQNRLQVEEIEALAAEQESLQKENDALAAEAEASRENTEGIQSEIQEGYKHKDQEIIDLKAELEEFKEMVGVLENENKEYVEKVKELEEKLVEDENVGVKEQAEIEMLKNKLELVEEQNQELKKEGLDFKTTILTAQKFADNLRQTSEEEAEKMMQEARDDVEKFRNDAHAELARLPKEIDELKQKKMEVREELRVTLQSYLTALDAFSSEDSEKDDDLSDLFQSIQIPDGKNVDSDDIDNIKMDL